MKPKSKNFSPLLRIAITIITQCILGGLSFITGIIMPKYMGPVEYGYYQIYFFYIGYINILGLGFNDGLVLNYAGYNEIDIPYKNIRSSIRIILGYILVISATLTLIINLFLRHELQYIYMTLILNIFPSILFCILVSLILAKNQSILYNITSIIQKVIACILFVYFIINQNTGYHTMITSDTFARYMALVLVCIIEYKFLFGKGSGFQDGFYVVRSSVSSGIKIMISVILAGLMPMFSRVIIEWNESIKVYGVYSFTLSLLSIILTFTSTIGIIIFPMMKRLTREKLLDYYSKFCFLYELFVACAFIIYIPLTILINKYMIEYRNALAYLPILIAVCMPLGKIQLLLFPYYKTLRYENDLLVLNILGFVLMVISTITIYFTFRSVVAVAIITLIVMIIYVKIIEIHLYKRIGFIYNKFYNLDILIIIAFLIYAYVANITVFGILYLLSIFTYIFINRKKVKNIVKGLNICN